MPIVDTLAVVQFTGMGGKLGKSLYAATLGVQWIPRVGDLLEGYVEETDSTRRIYGVQLLNVFRVLQRPNGSLVVASVDRFTCEGFGDDRPLSDETVSFLFGGSQGWRRLKHHQCTDFCDEHCMKLRFAGIVYTGIP